MELENVKTSDDGHLLMQSVRKSCIERVIDWKTLGITKDYIREQFLLGEVKRKEALCNYEDHPSDDRDRYFVAEMCMPYNPPPDDRDMFVWYDDTGVLSGTAGYLRIRDGYVYSRRVVIIS